MCGIARKRLRIFSSLSSLKSNASPPGENVAHFGVLFEITKRFFEVGVQFLFAHAADDAAAGNNGSNSRNDPSPKTERDPDTDAPNPAPACANLRRTDPPCRKATSTFLDPRNDLAPNRAIRIVALDQVEKMRGDGERELRSGKQHAIAFFVRKFEMLLELGERRHPVLSCHFQSFQSSGGTSGQ